MKTQILELIACITFCSFLGATIQLDLPDEFDLFFYDQSEQLVAQEYNNEGGHPLLANDTKPPSFDQQTYDADEEALQFINLPETWMDAQDINDVTEIEPTELTEYTETELTESTETEPTESTETEPADTTETEPTDTTETEPTGSTGTDATDTTETKPTGTTETEPTDITETEPTGSTKTEPTDAPETEPTGTTRTEPTDTTETEPTDTTEAEPTDNTETEPTDTTDTEPTDATKTEPTGSTATEPTGSIATEPIGSTATEPTGSLATKPTGYTTGFTDESTKISSSHTLSTVVTTTLEPDVPTVPTTTTTSYPQYVLGGPCFDGIYCAVDHSECKSGICTCKVDFVQEGLRSCKHRLSSPCLSDLDCLANSTCAGNVTRTCSCNSSFVAADDLTRCAVRLGYDCTESAECIENAECSSTGECECQLFHFPVIGGSYCTSFSIVVIPTYSIHLVSLLASLVACSLFL